jgi:hypothetical protein
MPTSTSDGIPKPASTDAVAPLEGWFQGDSNGTQTAIDRYKITRVATSASLPASVAGRYLIAQAIDTGFLWFNDGTSWTQIGRPGTLAQRQAGHGIYVQNADPGAATAGTGALWVQI